jgi:hypothetical protein
VHLTRGDGLPDRDRTCDPQLRRVKYRLFNVSIYADLHHFDAKLPTLGSILVPVILKDLDGKVSAKMILKIKMYLIKLNFNL